MPCTRSPHPRGPITWSTMSHQYASRLSTSWKTTSTRPSRSRTFQVKAKAVPRFVKMTELIDAGITQMPVKPYQQSQTTPTFFYMSVAFTTGAVKHKHAKQTTKICSKLQEAYRHDNFTGGTCIPPQPETAKPNHRLHSGPDSPRPLPYRPLQHPVGCAWRWPPKPSPPSISAP